MVIKKLLPLILMIGALVSPTSSNEATIAKAEEPVQVKSGYITKNLVDSEKGYVDFDNESTKTLFENNFEIISKQEMYYDDGVMLNIMGDQQITYETSSATAISRYNPHEEHYNYTDVRAMSNFLYVNTRPNVQIFNTYCHITLGLDYRFAGTDYTKPLELALSMDLNKIEEFLTTYCEINLALPIVSVNGYDYFTLNFKAEDKSITYTSSNSRVYVTRQTYTDDGEGNVEYEYGDYVFLEIPYTQSLRTIKVFDNRWFSPNASQRTPFYILKGTLDNSIRTPLTISNLDFNTGRIVTNSSNSIYFDENGEANINAVTCNYYKLTSLLFNDGTKLYAKALNKHPSNRQEEYELYTDEALTNKFTYDASNSLAVKLRTAAEDTIFSIKQIAYDTMTKANESSDYATKSDIVDCKTYYAFKKISKDQIHTVTFNTIHAKNIFYTRLAFSAYDDDARVYIDKINALWFEYSFNGAKYNFTLNAVDFEKSVTGGDLSSPWLGSLLLNSVNQIVKQDERTKVNFTLTGMKNSDYICFNWNEKPALKTTSNSDMFLIYTSQDIFFESMVSCVYVDKQGDIINASADLPDGTQAPTVVIGEDGSVTVWDKNGNKIDGTVDKDGNFIDGNGKIREHADNVDNSADKANQKKWEDILDTLKKILALIPTIAIGVGVVWLIGKLGPSIISLFKKKE
ncbi:MAG: hypothetical protein MR766_05745 [Erysipelotrichaceae bacterium]|nr:hypothetical protein [Erysipelotrichaceae bacterium]